MRLFFNGANLSIQTNLGQTALSVAGEGLAKFLSKYDTNPNLKKAHTALKPYWEIKAFLRKNRFLASCFIEAYEAYCYDDKPDMLHNLIFPLAKKKFHLPFSPIIINEQLLGLFKRDHIKWLLYALVVTKFDQTFAQELVRLLELKAAPTQ